MVKYTVQKLNTEEKKFQWLDLEPILNESNQSIENISWTYDHEKSYSFTSLDAQKWASMIPNTDLVRFGEPEKEENIDFNAIEIEKKKEAIEKYIKVKENNNV